MTSKISGNNNTKPTTTNEAAPAPTAKEAEAAAAAARAKELEGAEALPDTNETHGATSQPTATRHRREIITPPKAPQSPIDNLGEGDKVHIEIEGKAHFIADAWQGKVDVEITKNDKGRFEVTLSAEALKGAHVSGGLGKFVEAEGNVLFGVAGKITLEFKTKAEVEAYLLKLQESPSEALSDVEVSKFEVGVVGRADGEVKCANKFAEDLQVEFGIEGNIDGEIAAGYSAGPPAAMELKAKVTGKAAVELAVKLGLEVTVGAKGELSVEICRTFPFSEGTTRENFNEKLSQMPAEAVSATKVTVSGKLTTEAMFGVHDHALGGAREVEFQAEFVWGELGLEKGTMTTSMANNQVLGGKYKKTPTEFGDLIGGELKTTTEHSDRVYHHKTDLSSPRDIGKQLQKEQESMAQQEGKTVQQQATIGALRAGGR